MSLTPSEMREIVSTVIEEEGISQPAFGKLAGVSGKQVNRWVNGGTPPTPQKVARALRSLGRDPIDYGLPAADPTRDPVLEEIIERLTRLDDRAEHVQPMWAARLEKKLDKLLEGQAKIARKISARASVP